MKSKPNASMVVPNPYYALFLEEHGVFCPRGYMARTGLHLGLLLPA
ncbi:MAG: hypothetical protein V1909_04485 [Candidatus Micrarchaeota archaeon]